MANSWIIKFRIFLWLILTGVVGWLLYMGIVPGGKISYVYNFTKPNYFIAKLMPEERVKPIENGSQKIIGDPVYFSLRTPRRFEKAILSLKYKRQTEESKTLRFSLENRSVLDSIFLPIIETGVLVDKTIWRYNLKPMENRIIDQLSLVWNKIEGDGIMFLQREKKYETIEDFLNNLPASREIAAYNYDLKTNFILEDYEPSDIENNIIYPIRGAYQFYTYIKNEDLNFSFDFFDLNKNKDKEEINLYLYYADKLVDSRSMSESEGEENDSETERGKIDWQLKNLSEGAYKIEVKAGDDIITKTIKTKQQKLAFINKIWLYGDGNENIKLFSDSSNINAQTINPGSLQKIKIKEGELNLSETYKMFSVSMDGGVKEIILEKDDVIISGDGSFGFTEESIINPAIKKVNANLDIVGSPTNYILAGYNIPISDGDWKIAKAEFDLTNAYRESGKYSFLISIPGLRADDGVEDGIEIKEIKFDLEGTSLWEKVEGLLSKI